MIRITISSPELTEALRELAERTNNLTPALRDIRELLVTSTRRHFLDSKAPDGTPWAPNKPITLERFLSKSYGGEVPRKRDGSLKAPAAKRASVVEQVRTLAAKLPRLPAEIGARLGESLPLDAITKNYEAFFDEALANRAERAKPCGER